MSGIKEKTMRRLALSVQYHGRDYRGFAYQPGQESLERPLTVEGRLRYALSKLLPTPLIDLQVSSRTDRGVHALYNTFQIDIDQKMTCYQIYRGLNFHLTRQPVLDDEHRPLRRSVSRRKKAPLRHDVFILSCREPPLTMHNPFPDGPPTVPWHVRHSATQRTYLYRILLARDEQGLPFEYDRSWRIHYALDIEEMRRAAQHLVGIHDFSAFRGARCQRQSPVTSLVDVQVSLEDNPTFPSAQVLDIQFTGDAFLYRQVRNMVGCLVAVGRGEIHAVDVAGLLEAKDRSIAPAMAPASGLFLIDVQHGEFVI